MAWEKVGKIWGYTAQISKIILNINFLNFYFTNLIVILFLL